MPWTNERSTLIMSTVKLRSWPREVRGGGRRGSAGGAVGGRGAGGGRGGRVGLAGGGGARGGRRRAGGGGLPGRVAGPAAPRDAFPAVAALAAPPAHTAAPVL